MNPSAEIKTRSGVKFQIIVIKNPELKNRNPVVKKPAFKFDFDTAAEVVCLCVNYPFVPQGIHSLKLAAADDYPSSGISDQFYF